MDVNYLAERGRFLSEVANFGQVGIQWKGYSVNSQNGTATYQLSQPGNMKQLVGVTVFSVATAGTAITDQRIDLVINSNKVLDTVPLLAICPQGLSGHTNNSMPFFPIYRSLNGNDDITVQITSTQALNIYLVAYFMP